MFDSVQLDGTSDVTRGEVHHMTRDDAMDAEHDLLAQVTQERARLEAVLQQMPGGVVIVDAASGRVLMINAEAERLACPPGNTALTPHEFARGALVERGSRLVHPDSWPLTRALRSGHITVNQEMQYLRDDGSLGTVMVSAGPIFDHDQIVAAVATFNDVTEQIRLTEELRFANLEAERARADADRANAAKSEFLSTMSHEIRTPLNAIIGYVQLLEMGVGGSGTEAQRSYLTRLRMSSDHLLALVNEVLDLAKVESGSLTLQRQIGRSDDVVDAAIGLIAPLATTRGLVIQHLRPNADDMYIADEDRVRQILVNLLGNAIKFTPSGGAITVECSTTGGRYGEELDQGAPATSNERWATITVTDTGIGIPASKLPTVFDHFVQLDAATQASTEVRTPVQRGTGLGLTISRRLARAMGGDLTVRSRENEGSVFILWLPASHIALT